jgi:fermentation-respiration switch protein FrsA (DUF1100 family)
MTLAQGLIAAILGWGLLNGVFYLAQSGMVFFPTKPLAANPRDWGLDYEDVTLTTDDGVGLHGWLIPAPSSRRTLLFFHGNAGNISHRGDSIAIFHRLGLDVLIVDYRGYGLSGGAPSERGLDRDAHAAWRLLTQERGVSADNIVIFGRSLGGVVAARLAAKIRPAGLILESTPSSARDAAHALFPLLSHLVLLRFDLDAAEAVRHAVCPVLVLHSPDDEIIPYRLGRKVFSAASEPKRFFDLRGGHNDGFLLSQPSYEHALAEFLAALPNAGLSAARDRP